MTPKERFLAALNEGTSIGLKQSGKEIENPLGKNAIETFKLRF